MATARDNPGLIPPATAEAIARDPLVGHHDTPARVRPEPDFDALVRQAWEERCAALGLDPDDPDVIAEAIAPEESAAYDRLP